VQWRQLTSRSHKRTLTNSFQQFACFPISTCHKLLATFQCSFYFLTHNIYGNLSRLWKNLSRNFDGFTCFCHPWLLKLVFGNPSV
jgi:hypothetical protein